jgi:glycerophosphoryl diester phosphodiesterase
MKIIGHRGARRLAPENTVEAILRAVEVGVDEVEIDVRVTKDGIPILIHDSKIAGSGLWPMFVHQHTFSELRQFLPQLATLDEAIVAVNRRIPLIIEVKTVRAVVVTASTLKLFLSKGWQADDFLLASFRYRVIRRLHTALPEVEKIINEHFSGIYGSFRARLVGARRIAFNRRCLWGYFIASMTRHGYHVGAFTINNPQQAERWALHGLFSVVTDYPDRFIAQAETATHETIPRPSAAMRPTDSQRPTPQSGSKQEIPTHTTHHKNRPAKHHKRRPHHQ